ncbi:MAG: hypothetical protein UT90_C0020G0012 [Parcubacteria group bacterium GW2011_GWA1_40_21]|nr:MAG: hypothetical protein UT90_C0020G0012 [Parcubacteria group bacterium GW2011_GWA1_40_21]
MISFGEIKKLTEANQKEKKIIIDEKIDRGGEEVAQKKAESLEEEMKREASDGNVECTFQLGEYEDTNHYPDVSQEDILVYKILSKKLDSDFETKTEIRHSKYTREGYRPPSSPSMSGGTESILVTKFIMHVKWGRW